MSEPNIKNIYKKIISNNYLSNSYRHLTRSKVIHFLVLLIEIVLNIIEELDAFIRDFNPGSIGKEKNKLSFISILTEEINNNLPKIFKIVLMLIYVIIFDSLYLFLEKKNFLIKYTYIAIIVNILELFHFRILMIFHYNMLFSLTSLSFLVTAIILSPHLYLIIHNFLYNHLYYFVPKFIEYPYDEFSSLFDIVLLVNKILIAIVGNTQNAGLGKFCFIILFLEQIFFSFYFIYQLVNHSYLFMKNSFLNMTRICLFISQTLITIFALLIGKNEIISILFIIIGLSVLLIIMGYLYCMYNPFSYVKINRETPVENILFYLYTLSNKNVLDFLLENKIHEHYEKCGICNLCRKYIYYFNKYEKTTKDENDEKDKLINKEKLESNKDIKNRENQLTDLFNIVYDGNNKYFHLVKKMETNYRVKGKEFFNNNAHYYVNLLFLIYSDYENDNITLSLNEKLILEIINYENRFFIDSHQTQIVQLLLSNEFINLSHQVISKLKNILNSEQNLNKAKKLIDLSFMLKQMRSKKYKRNLFGHKLETISNARNLISACSIIYEEIFNTTLNNSQMPIRENIQPLEDIFINNQNKIDKIVSLSVDLNKKRCKIVRAGKGLAPYLNNNLFDLFPLILQQYQINLFISTILKNFDNSIVKEKNNETPNNNIVTIKRKDSKKSVKVSKNIKSLRIINNNVRNKREYVEIKLILCESIFSKIYYKLLTLKLTPLFNNDNNYFILFDGLFYLHKHTIVTMIDYEKNKQAEEKLFAVSEPELEKNSEAYSIPLKKYNIWQINQGYAMSKVSSFNISFKLYSIYLLVPRDKDMKKKYDKNLNVLKDDKFFEEDDEEEQTNSFHRNTRIEKLQIIDDNASMASQATINSHERGLSGLNLRNKKKDTFYEYSGFNKLQKIIHITIILILIILLIQYFHLYSLENDTKNNTNSFLEYREFYKLYFQLFSLTLSVACIQEESSCRSIISYFADQYFSEYPEDDFNVTTFFYMQSEILARKIMDKKSYMNNIHSYVGTEKYQKFFGKTIDYIRISQTFIKDDIKYDIIPVKTQFSEAILIVCNSFKFLTTPNDTKSSIYFLNKTVEPFTFINTIRKEKELLTYQKEIYEMILNYKVYSREFDSINYNLTIILNQKSNVIEIFIYLYISLDTLMNLFVGLLIYLYVSFFEDIIIKILNYINMRMNVKNDDFKFDETFTKKLDNLEVILQLFNEPLKAVNKLTKLYTEYQQYLTNKNKNEAMEMGKRGYRKNIEEENKKNEMYNVPKNQRIINKNEIKNLKIVSKYLIIFYLSVLITILIFISLNILWLELFNIKKNLFSLIDKNCNLESSLYRAINIYNLMIFDNFTINEVTKNIYPSLYDPNESISILKSFYVDLKLAFNSKKEKDSLGNLYEDIEDSSNFTCQEIYDLNDDIFDELKESNVLQKPPDIKEKLISMCENTKLTESNDPRTLFERHFQRIKNGIVTINDFSYEGLIAHIKEGIIGRVSLFFNNVIIYTLEIIFAKPHKLSVAKLLVLLKKYIIITELTFIVVDIIFIIIIIFFFISKIKKYCNQILLLKKTFKICESQEQ